MDVSCRKGEAGLNTWASFYSLRAQESLINWRPSHVSQLPTETGQDNLQDSGGGRYR